MQQNDAKKTTRERVIELAKEAWKPSDIATAVNLTPNTVSHYIAEARKAGADIPPFTSAQGKARNSVLTVPPVMGHNLRILAKSRGLTMQELVHLLLERIVRNDLVTAVLDDGRQS